MKHASLCTGIGACELAATWMGWENLFSCEVDEFCNRVLKHHYPKAIHYGNIFEQDFREWRGRVDVLTAGFPCQPFSFAGKRNGAEDDRYLWPEVLRVIKEVRPTWFIGENVAGIISMVLPGEEITVGSYEDICGESYEMHEKRQRYVIEQIRLDLASIGYSVQPVVIPACAVGAPHRRDRVWFIASNRDSAGLQTQGAEQQATGIAGDGLQRLVTHAKSDGSDRTPGTTSEEIKRSNGDEAKQPFIGSEIRTFANPSEPGFQERVNRGEWEDQEEDGTGANIRFKRSSGKQSSSDPSESRLQGNIDSGKQTTMGIVNNIREYSPRLREPNATDPERIGSHKVHENIQPEQPNGAIIDGISSERDDRRCITIPNWEKFPTQSPVCGRDDGISTGLLGITFSKWRQQSIKALGNSMVPQVVYEIFKAIAEVENLNDKNK